MATSSAGAAAGESGADPHTGGKDGTSAARDWDWSGLPAPALLSISMFLTGSLADVLAFRRVCRAWRSVAKANERELTSSLPPLLFTYQNAVFYCPADSRLYQNRALAALLDWEGPVEVVGCSLGHLILLHLDRGTFSVVNPLTGACAAKFPPNFRALVKWAVLSCSPASPDCVLWSSNGHFMEFCRLGDRKWTLFWFQEASYVPQPVFLHGKGYLHYQRQLATFHINPCSSESVPVVPVGGPPPPSPRCVEPRLCVSDAELLQVRVVRHTGSGGTKGFLVHRFEFSVADWVRLDSLGDRALFWDTFGVTLSDEPSKWGGRGNCIYFVDFDDEKVCVFHLEDGRIERPSQGSPSNQKLRCQSPVWILPNLLVSPKLLR